MWVKFQPTTLASGSWDTARDAVREQLIDTVTAYAPNFRRSVIDSIVYTPQDMEQRVGLTDGNIHHLDHSVTRLLGDRLFPGGYRTPITGLYMCGAGTHPGGEVSGAPGHNAARIVLADLDAHEQSSRGCSAIRARQRSWTTPARRSGSASRSMPTIRPSVIVESEGDARLTAGCPRIAGAPSMTAGCTGPGTTREGLGDRGDGKLMATVTISTGTSQAWSRTPDGPRPLVTMPTS